LGKRTECAEKGKRNDDHHRNDDEKESLMLSEKTEHW